MQIFNRYIHGDACYLQKELLLLMMSWARLEDLLGDLFGGTFRSRTGDKFTVNQSYDV